MTMASEVNANAPAAQGLFGRMFSGLAERYTRYWTYRKCVDELEALSNRELNDLGLSRSAIRSVAHAEAYGANA